jgi:hypothetical protein
MPRNYKTPLYYKRHYEALAAVMQKVIRNIPDDPACRAVVEDTLYHLIAELKFNGSQFDSARFRAACEKPNLT